MTTEERLAKFLGKKPHIHPSAFIAPTATVVGDVTLAERVSIWYGAVLRGDINFIRVGSGSNIQDLACVHLADDFPCIIGERVTVGHGAIVHACTIGDDCLVGMGAIILDGTELGDHCLVAAGSLITGGKKFPPGSLIMGSPAKVVRQLSPEEQQDLPTWAAKYLPVAAAHKSLKTPQAQS